MAFKILFLNLPNVQRVQRRYMCSYNAPNMLFPPIELLYLAAIGREWHKSEVFLIDSIAENLSIKELEYKIEQLSPNIIVTLTGFEIFEEDILLVKRLKLSFEKTKFVLFGHYATTFPEETFKYSNADFILEGEPDINFSNLLDHLEGKVLLEELCGVYFTKEHVCKIKHGEGRIKKPDILPLPAHDLLKIEAYNEPFLAKPFALIQTARGCPYACNFCVRSYGKKLGLRSPGNIIEELLLLKQVHNIKSFRIIDDTFTATPKRVIELCQLMVDNELELEWTCLSRADTLNEEMIFWMKKAGCKRVYIGVESGSESVLEAINKKIDLDSALENLKLLNKYKIETSAFFMVGHPLETEDDFIQSVDFAIKADFDYIMAFEFVCYPGTDIFTDYKDEIEFSLFPYKNQFRNNIISSTSKVRVKKFYRMFYFRPKFIFKSFSKIINNPIELISNFYKSLSFQLTFRNKKSIRNDFI